MERIRAGSFPSFIFLKKAGKNKSQKRVAGCNLEYSALKAHTIYASADSCMGWLRLV